MKALIRFLRRTFPARMPLNHNIRCNPLSAPSELIYINPLHVVAALPHVVPDHPSMSSFPERKFTMLTLSVPIPVYGRTFAVSYSPDEWDHQTVDALRTYR